MSGDRGPHDDVLERPRREPPRDVGPQGEALILELQRLRQAFERDDWNEATCAAAPSTSAAGRVRRRRAPVSRRKKKRGMGRVIEVCLEQFGLNAEPPAPRRTSPPRPSPSAGVTAIRPAAAAAASLRHANPAATADPGR